MEQIKTKIQVKKLLTKREQIKQEEGRGKRINKKIKMKVKMWILA